MSSLHNHFCLAYDYAHVSFTPFAAKCVCVCVYREKWSAFVIPEKSENFGKITNSCKQELSQNLE